MIDSGSSSDILFLDALITFSKTKDDFKKVDFPLIGFAESTTYLLGDMSRPVVLGDGWKSLKTYLVVAFPHYATRSWDTQV